MAVIFERWRRKDLQSADVREHRRGGRLMTFDNDPRIPNRPRPLFELGRVVGTPSAVALMRARGIQPADLLDRHASGDWGDVPASDALENELSVREGFRIMSSYRNGADRLWVITEADRSATTILLPEEY